MSAELPTLTALIAARLAETGGTRADLAARIGVSPVTISRWSDRLPPAATTRDLAAALDLPYAMVLASALRSGGYAETLADVLEGHTVIAAFRDPAAPDIDDEDSCAVALFADDDHARDWASVWSDLDQAKGYGPTATMSVTIGADPIPDAVAVYTSRWDAHNGITDSGPDYHLTWPDNILSTPEGALPPVDVWELADTGRVYAVDATGRDPKDTRRAVQEVIDMLNSRGQLASPSEAPAAATGVWAKLEYEYTHPRVYRSSTSAAASVPSVIGPEMAAWLRLQNAIAAAYWKQSPPISAYDEAIVAAIPNIPPPPPPPLAVPNPPSHPETADAGKPAEFTSLFGISRYPLEALKDIPYRWAGPEGSLIDSSAPEVRRRTIVISSEPEVV